ncbi:flavodoxin [Methanomassiliicoccales archaeon RumEn M2]|nr:flavodoxin [Methanomassiliicoccales archaeon RumEn M2]
MADSLVIYYSRKGQNYFSGSIRSVSKGNTEYAAEYIASAVGADIFEVDTVRPYSEDYTECTEEAKREKKDSARPELKEYIPDVSQYRDVFVCGPCWWGTFPMAVFSQLDRLDLDGKKLIPVMTHEGSGLGSCESDLKRLYPGAIVGEGLAIRGGEAQSSERMITQWAKRAVGKD